MTPHALSGAAAPVRGHVGASSPSLAPCTPPSISHQLIEEFMLAANEAVAATRNAAEQALEAAKEGAQKVKDAVTK